MWRHTGGSCSSLCCDVVDAAVCSLGVVPVQNLPADRVLVHPDIVCIVAGQVLYSHPNTCLDADSTPAQLRGRPTSCGVRGCRGAGLLQRSQPCSVPHQHVRPAQHSAAAVSACFPTTEVQK